MNPIKTPILIHFILILFLNGFYSEAQTTYTWANSSSGGSWNTPSNWIPSTGFPGPNDNAIINPSAAIIISDVTSKAVNSITVNGVTAADTVILTSSSTDTLTINNNVTVTGGGISAGGSLTLLFNLCSSYNHERDGGAVPVAVWRDYSNCNITGILANQPRNMHQTFYNFLWDCPNQSSVIFFKGNFPKGINGTCEFRRIGASTQCNWDLINGTTWAGDLIISANKNLILTSQSGNVPTTFTIRDLYITSDYGTLSRLVMSNMGNSQSYFTFNIRNVYVNGGSFDFNGIWSNNTRVNVRGNLTMSAGFIGNSNNLTAGVSELNFVGTTQQDINITGGTVTGRANTGDPTRTFVINANANSIVNFVNPLVCGTGTYVTFNANSGATLMIPDKDGIISGKGQTTGSVRVPNTGGSVSFSTAANYSYTGNTDQTTGTGLPATVNKLTIDNNSGSATGVVLTNSVTVTGSLILSNGRISTGSKNLTLAASGSLSGTPSASAMIVADGNGQFIRGVSSGASSLLFPVGTISQNYFPVTLNFSANTSAGTIGIRNTDSAEPNNNTPSAPAAYLSAYWTFSNTGLTSYIYTGTFSYPSSAVTGNESALRLSRWTGSAWSEDAGSSASSGSLRETGTLDQTSAPLTGNFTGRTQSAPACSAPSLSAKANGTLTAINVCTAASVTLTANATGGTGCTGSFEYAWHNGTSYWNGTAFASSTPVYNSTYSSITFSPVTGATYLVTGKCSDDATCISSSDVTVSVLPSVTPSVSISTSQTIVASGTSVTFTAAVTNGGSSPVYRWKKNGSNTGSNSATYTDSNFTNNDVITCEVTSNAPCLISPDAISNSIKLTVISAQASSVTISASQNSICAGATVTFSATPANGGATPYYQWKKNGTNVGTNSTVYTDNGLTDKDEISCVMTVSSSCSVLANVTSNVIAVTVNSFVTPSVTISASQTTICPGTEITFSATAKNGGSSPSYQWKLNGNNVGTDSESYSNNTLADGDTITCIMTSNANCLTTSSATSDGIGITISSTGRAGTISAQRDTICDGTPGILTVTGVAGAIQWQSASAPGNFTDIAGATNADYTAAVSATSYFRVSGLNGNCTTLSDTFLLTVIPSPVADFTATATGLKVDYNSSGSTGAVRFSWDFGDNTSLSTEENPSHTYAAPGNYKTCLTAYNGSNCSFTTCKEFQIDFPAGIAVTDRKEGVTVYPNPTNGLLTVNLNSQQSEKATVTVYNLFGQKLSEETFVIKQGENIFNLRFTGVAAAGVYRLNIKTGQTEFNSSVIYQP